MAFPTNYDAPYLVSAGGTALSQDVNQYNLPVVNLEHAVGLSSDTPATTGTLEARVGYLLTTSLNFGTPALTFGTANASGTATTAVRTDATLLAFGTAVATTGAPGDSATAGTATLAARRDHRHGWPSFGTVTGSLTQGNDARLSDARTPTAHATTHVTVGQDPLPTFTTGTRGLVAPPGGSPSGTKFLSDLGTWVDPAIAAGGMSDPMTTEDDLMVGGTPSGGTAAPQRLGKGTDGQVLTVIPSTHHVGWRTIPSFGVSVDGLVTGPGSVVAGQFLASSGAWATPSGSGFSNPMTTAGDLIYGGASGTATRLAVGTTGYVLTVVSGTPAWAAAGTGGGGGGGSNASWDPYGNAVAPVASTFSTHDHWSGSGFITRLDQNTDNMVFYNPAAVSTIERGAFVPSSVPTPPYTVTACIVPNLVEIDFAAVSLCLRASGSDKRIILRVYHDTTLKLGDLYFDDYQTLTGGTGTPSGALGWTQGFPIWLRFRDDASNLFYEYSRDGENWVIYQTKTTGTHATMNQAGITMDSFTGGSGSAYSMAVLSWEILNTA